MSITTLIVLSVMAGQPCERPSTIKPRALRRGDVIGLVAPAGPLDDAAVRQAVEALRAKGYGVKLSHGYETPRGYLASSDEVRAAELMRFMADPEIRAVVAIRGGYGTPRIIDRIDYELIRRNPKILVGYSDITALLNAVYQRTGLVVFHGPMAREIAGSGLPPYTAKYFWESFREDTELRADWGAGFPRGRGQLDALVPGVAEGVLVGGNLSVLTSTVGTPYEVCTRGTILFLEEVNEEPRRVDRMLNQLRLSGKLADAHGVLLGAFTGCDRPTRLPSLTLSEVFHDFLLPLGVPVLSGFPAGHVPDQATLPFGVRVRLDATAKKLSILESPVSGNGADRSSRSNE